VIPDFILNNGKYSELLKELGIINFSQACDFIQKLPYGRNTNRDDFGLILSERKGTCSTKHALLSILAEENNHPEIELIAGIFLMNGETHSSLKDFFSDKPYLSLPEMHCYLRYNGVRYDFTSFPNKMPLIDQKIVREQRIEPHQVGDWKVMIHKHYLGGWLKRNPQVEFSLEELWMQREECIRILSL